MELSEKLAALRKRSGLTQQEVAERLDLSRQAVSRWESGQIRPSTENLRAISALYGVTADYLLRDDAPEDACAVSAPVETVPAESSPAEEAPAEPEGRKKNPAALLIALVLLLCAALAAGFLLKGSRPVESGSSSSLDYLGEAPNGSWHSSQTFKFTMDWHK